MASTQPQTQSPAQPMGVLDGVRVLELARWQAAPRGGMILRDMGAEVIKLEWSKSSDLRNSGPFVGDMSVQFAAYNRGKKSVTLNARHPEGKELFYKLLEHSDVVLENFRPGTVDRMGFSYEKMCEIKPDIILASVSGFGQFGPYRDRQCFDPIIQAMSGIGHQTGRGFDQPVMAEGPIMDRTAALHATIGILGALRHRDRTGEGQWLEVSMLDGGITLEEVALAMCHETGTNDFTRAGSFIECKDGYVSTGAARAGMENFTKTAAWEWGRYGVRVNAVAPGIVASSGLTTYDPMTRKKLLMAGEMMPARRLCTEAEVSASIVFLLTPAAAFINGETLHVDGGAQFGSSHMYMPLPRPKENNVELYDGFHRSNLDELLAE